MATPVDVKQAAVEQEGPSSDFDLAVVAVDLALSRLERASGSEDDANIDSQEEKARATFDDVSARLDGLAPTEGQRDALLGRLTLLRTMLQAGNELF
jgi:hypothetical protein